MSEASKFKTVTISPVELDENIFKLIGTDWTLITAGNKNGINTMTASWGCAGILWNKPVCVCFIRPQRYTLGFVEDNDRLSLSFFDDSYRQVLSFCGRHSGRDTDKFSSCGLTPIFDENETPYIEEARLTLLCRKLYVDDLKRTSFIDRSLLKNYTLGDYHRFFICEIEKVIKKEFE